MNDYTAARTIGKIISFFGWLALAISVFGLVALLGFGQAAMLGLPIIFSSMLGGLLMIAQGQLLQVQVDTASNTGALYRLLSEQRAQVDIASNTGELVRLLREQINSPIGASPAPAFDGPAYNPGVTHAPRIDASDSVDSSEPTMLSLRARLDPDVLLNKYRGHKIHLIRETSGRSFKVGNSMFNSLDEAADFIDQLA